uniref:Uncharacterized protein n=1 Tax=Amphimedon queenslandica TaxID=400682 RepID=A0A1X7UTH5_AMPQE
MNDIQNEGSDIQMSKRGMGLATRDSIQNGEGFVLGFVTESETVEKGSVLQNLRLSRLVLQQRKGPLNAFFLSLILGIPTVIVAFASSFDKDLINWPKIYGEATLQEIILATIIQSLKLCSASIDILIIALATTIAFVYSVIIVFVAAFVTRKYMKTFFETLPMLLMFVSLGHWLEYTAKGKTFKALAN